MVISKIEINNIKGIGNLTINQNIHPNRPNILVLLMVLVKVL
ncbi:hypothetical protein MSHRCOH1_05015 [Candidatus Ornithobacterium hominis]|nr:hypothetical protein MSHRCOH1_05015 [Candidatus Ornithobacterium hominis]